MFHIAGLVPGSLKYHPSVRFTPPTGEATGGGWVGGWVEEMEDISDYGSGIKCMKKRLS